MLGTLETLEKVVADAASLQQRLARPSGLADHHHATEAFDGAAEEGRADDALGHLGTLLLAGAVVTVEV